MLKRALESVVNQTFSDWIMVIVNDGGDSGEIDKLVESYQEKFTEKITVIHNQTSIGMEAASNKGIQNSSSEYVVIHDDDDSWHKDFLKTTIGYMDQCPYDNVKGVITHSIKVVEKIDNDKVIELRKAPFNSSLDSITLYRMCASNLFPPISFLYKRSVFDEIGMYNSDLPVLGDWDFNLRFMGKFDIHVIKDSLAFYHHRLVSKSSDYSNSVIGGIDKHKMYDTILRNKYLRDDISKNKIGIGLLVNISKSVEEINRRFFLFDRVINYAKYKLKKFPFIK
ncbi:glycosyltransferase family 2 protein [Paenibacillus ginsengarvi]|uniref:glycosyltransferase family 2 protein n=1 Tax=Paenibacillus ginsengarvi TaxID=400777 RepID=UPI003B833743